MTWREGSNQAGFSIVGLHKIHHDDIPQVLTEKLAQELRECAHNMHKDLTSVLLEHMQEGVELILKEMIQKYSVYCIRSRKRLRWQLQTFETAVANVCDRGCKRLRFSSTNVRVTRPSLS